MARRGKKLFSFLEVTDDTPIQKLSIAEQFRLLVRKLSNSDAEQLKADSAETVYMLQLQADLREFLYKATAKVRNGDEKSVTMEISSKFLPVLNTVLNSPAINPFYTWSISKPEIDLDIDYFFTLTLEAKSY